MEEPMTMFTVYEKPADYPIGFVVRKWLIFAGQAVAAEARFAESLEKARELIPVGFARIARNPNDDATVVESWL